MKRKGFTLVELLVVIAIIALLMGILMPALARVRQIAYRMVCGTNLSAFGRAIMLYANDNNEDYPCAGAGQPNTRIWTADGKLADWDSLTASNEAFGDGATIGASFYLLVKFADVTTKQFVCKGDMGTRIFKISDYGIDAELEDVQDFGDDPGTYCSYSYHMPYRKEIMVPGYPVGSASEPECPLAADRNPYLDVNANVYLTTNTDPDSGEIAPEWRDGAYYDPDKTGNAAAHQREGQNVLFNDSHVGFERYPNVGIENDNIWGYWPVTPPAAFPTDPQMQVVNLNDDLGIHPSGEGDSGLVSAKDAYLVNEEND